MRTLLVTLLLASACSGPARVPRPYPEPRGEEILAWLTGIRERVRTLNADTLSDARIGKERANVKVEMLAAWGGRLRFRAASPNESTLAELASDGTTFSFIDVQNNCGDTGPATPENVGQLVRIVMPPDDVVTLLMGGVPLLPGAGPPRVTWQAEGGREIVELTDGARVQRIELDGRERRWDVLMAEVKDVQGKLIWRVSHKDFRSIGGVRMPGRSYFEQPQDNVLIRWRDHRINSDIPDAAWHLDIPAGLPRCS